jgi:transposase-like protein
MADIYYNKRGQYKHNGVLLFIRGVLGLHSIDDGSTCEFSRRFWDVHDYKVHKGGSGFLYHFEEYVCPACHETFTV